MTNVNIVYDNFFDDADIIAVPDELLPKIEAIGQEFLDWVPTATDSDYWVIENGRRYIVANTNGFIKWLNLNYCSDKKKAYIVKRNTSYRPEYRVIEF